MSETVTPSRLALDEATQDLLFRSAHTAYSFSDEPVDLEVLRDVWQLVSLAPTAMNGQPLRIALVQSPEAKARLLPLMAEGNRAKTAQAPVTAILAADIDFHEELPRVFGEPGQGYREAFAKSEQARTGSARMNAALQIGYFILGVRGAGLAAGPMAGFDADAVSQEFFPDGRHQALVVMNIGQPGDSAHTPRNPRLSFDEIATVV